MKDMLSNNNKCGTGKCRGLSNSQISSVGSWNPLLLINSLFIRYYVEAILLLKKKYLFQIGFAVYNFNSL